MFICLLTHYLLLLELLRNSALSKTLIYFSVSYCYRIMIMVLWC
jgi:hypothetical protein